MASIRKKCLVAFDFDCTVVDENTDVVVQSIPGFPALDFEFDGTMGWTSFMQKVFRHHHANGVTEKDFCGCLDSMSFAPGMLDLVTKLSSLDDVEMIIVSDANSFFIDHILEKNGLKGAFSEIATNPAKFDESGMLSIEPFTWQDHCKLSTANICKGDIIDKYIKRRSEDGVEFTVLGYAGDGHNDLCAMARLGENSLLFPRKGYRIMKSLAKYKMDGGVIKGKEMPYENGSEIHEAVIGKMSKVA